MRYFLLALTILALATAADKPLRPVTAEDELLTVEASAYVDKAAVAKLLGHDPGMDLIVVEVKLSPRGERKLQIDLDDFTLLSRNDGQRSQPLAPSQIAGDGALMVTSGGVRGSNGGTFNPNRRPIWGGIPGTGTRPRRLGGDEGETGGVATAETQATVATPRTNSENPLLADLKAKGLPRKETNESTAGLLYFFLEGKHKLKHLELMYKSPAGRMILDFEK